MKTRLLIFLFIFSTVASAAGTRGTGFLLFGDFGTGDANQKEVSRGMVKFCKTNVCEFVASLGDNFYPSGVTSTSDPKWKTHFETVYAALGIPFYASLGNHDYGGDVPSQIAYSAQSKLWKMPDRYFSYKKGNVELFAVDTNRFNDNQQAWLRKALNASTSPWKIVYGHHPIYSGGQHGNSQALMRDLLPILYGRANFYLAGHDHDQQVIAEEDSGIVFVVSGAAAQTRPVTSGKNHLYSAESLGFAHLLLADDGATLKMLDKAGSTLFEKSFPRTTP